MTEDCKKLVVDRRKFVQTDVSSISNTVAILFCDFYTHEIFLQK